MLYAHQQEFKVNVCQKKTLVNNKEVSYPSTSESHIISSSIDGATMKKNDRKSIKPYPPSRPSKDIRDVDFDPIHPALEMKMPSRFNHAQVQIYGDKLFANARRSMEDVFNEPICLFVPQAIFLFESSEPFAHQSIASITNFIRQEMTESCAELTDHPFAMRILGNKELSRFQVECMGPKIDEVEKVHDLLHRRYSSWYKDIILLLPNDAARARAMQGCRTIDA